MSEDNKNLFEWHPYPQTKPKHIGSYLVSIKKVWANWVVSDRLRICEYNGIDKWENIEDYEKVVAWVEIPEPYQKEEG